MKNKDEAMAYAERVRGAASAIENACGGAEIGVILGSGLGEYAGALEGAHELPYADIPGFPLSTESAWR